MIPRASITAWRKLAPWPDAAQVEQDLIMSRALVEIFRIPLVAEQAAFRGGTALHKLFFQPPGRYSEDIDLVQRQAGQIGPLINSIRDVLDPWLGAPKWKQGHGRFTLIYRFQTTFEPVVPMRLKIEINTREHFNIDGWMARELIVENSWFSGSATMTTYTLSELLGTKMRALYQRKKGRDLFDLWLGLTHAELNRKNLLNCFDRYMTFVGAAATRAQFEANMQLKLEDNAFVQDLEPLLRPELQYDIENAWKSVHEALISQLPGEPWKGLEPDGST